jgi:hypothetical protein
MFLDSEHAWLGLWTEPAVHVLRHMPSVESENHTSRSFLEKRTEKQLHRSDKFVLVREIVKFLVPKGDFDF